MGLVTAAIAALFIGCGVAMGRLLASRAFGIRGFRRATNTEEERGRPALAFARAGTSIVGIYLASVVLMGCALSGGKAVVDDVSMRVTVMKSGPAAEAGIENGDRIVSVNGEPVRDWDGLKKLVAAHPDATIDVEVERAGARRTFAVKTVGPKMMVAPFVEQRTLSAGELVAASFVEPLVIAKGFFTGFRRFLFGAEKSELSGPVGIAKETTSAAKEGMSAYLKLTAAMTAFWAMFVDLALLVVALVTSILPRRNSVLPTSGNSS